MSVSAEFECACEMEKRICELKIQMAKLEEKAEVLEKENAKLKATNKKYCDELVEYRVVQNSLENFNEDDCLDEEDFFNL